MKLHSQVTALALGIAALGMASPGLAQSDVPDGINRAETASKIKVVFVIAFENHDAKQIYGNKSDAPYINNTLMETYAYATNFKDVLPHEESEPHYLWMEAGTNKFSDHSFTGSGDATKNNSTKSTEHLVTQIKNAGTGLTWMSYQEGITDRTGKCPIESSKFYAAKHNPFVFFRDVSGSPPSKNNAYCISHHKDLSQLAGDLANNRVATYNFITPNLCNDMHGEDGCPSKNEIRMGDDWLKNNLPALISYVNANEGVIFLSWDEGDGTNVLPFLAVGPGVKQGYASTVKLNHSSQVKSIERILELPYLSTVSGATDFADLFEAGQFP